MGVAALLAGEPYSPTPFFSLVPWILRGQLLIPAFLIADIAATLGLLRRWRKQPQQRPQGRRKWAPYVLLPLIANLAIALTLKPMLGEKRGYLRRFMPDFSWLALVCGSVAVIWSLLRSVLMLRALRGPSKKEKIAL
jgi:hypothetical protein